MNFKNMSIFTGTKRDLIEEIVILQLITIQYLILAHTITALSMIYDVDIYENNKI